ncbi:unnamed protein product [Lactuca saligna]|uniref:Protein transport protein sec16 n=1 Tax=Lactuca saligna TaxID=75948 RepID=A0AA35YHV7_LACSI|nr:unnamed protein product [Lactuca saligna]
MASNPPFQVEDTDEDFFDKLVDDDDDDYKVTPLSSETTKLADGNDSDDAKAFANLGISDVGTGLEDLGKVGEACSSIDGDTKHASTDTFLDHGRPLVSSNSFAFDSVSEEPNTEVAGLEEPLGSTASWDHGSGGGPGVKEVQWAAFATEPAENDGNGFGSYNDFFTEFGDSSVDQIGKGGNLVSLEQNVVMSGSSNVVDDSMHRKNVNDYSNQFQEVQTYASAGEQSTEVKAYATSGEQSTDGQDPNSSQYWENLYPGWKYDANTGQWYQVNEGYDDVQGAHDPSTTSEWTEKPEVSYLQQQTVQSAVEAVAEKGMTGSVTTWNQTNESLSWDEASQENNGYPSNMVFDPQYPGWYYDMNTQEWCSLDAYNSQAQEQVNQNGYSATSTYYGGQDQTKKQLQVGSEGQDYKWKGSLSNVEQQMWQPAQNQVNQNGFSATATNTYYGNDEKTLGSQVFSSQGQEYKWNGSFSNVDQQGSSMWQPDTVAKSSSGPMSDPTGNQNSHGTSEFPAISGAQSFAPSGNFNQTTFKQGEMMNIPKTYGSMNQSGSGYSQQVQPFHSGGQQAGRSSAGRPPHALVTFGFGGKLIVMKDNAAALMNTSYGSQDSNGRSICIHSMAEISSDVSSSGADYFQSLGRQSFPGPLAGGNVGGKELSKWIDERITHSESSNMNYRDSQVLRLLLSLLKIASQHYGKLRSPFGTDSTSKENDAPEVAVARLFASVKKSGAEYNYGHFTHCLQQLPSERETQATASEVQTLLVSGKKIEALQCAQEGQLWGPALVLAAQLGDQFYVDTVRKMALGHLVAGSPLRTLCLLIAGQPADAFSADTTGAVNMSQQAEGGGNCMIEDWEENLAVITANRTKDDELVLIHLGDCLWKERSNIMAAHICYLVAEANFEAYSDTARLCLIGADHWKHPRTYAGPQAIQRTEVYEYAKLLGNSQFTLLPFQPYKLVYAHMLAEVGRVSDALKYCQSVSKSLKTGRAPEVELWRQLVSSLEDRIKTHQQGGFSTNLAPGKLVGKLLNLFDSTAHRVVGGLPPPVPSTSGGGFDHHQHPHQHQQPPPSRGVSTSQSTMAMSSLVASASMDQWSDDGNNRKIIHNRSVSEPDFGRSPRQQLQAGGDTSSSSKENSADSQTKSSSSASASASGMGITSRFGRFGFGSQLFQKTVGLVLKPRGGDKQAKLGDTNKFYYDEKLKRWVEEGVDPPAEEAALPPPPTMAAFQNGTPEYNLKTALKSEGSHSHLSNGTSDFTSPMPMGGHTSGIPPLPATTTTTTTTTTSNQFSARGRTGVRARYVDTFNQGGGNPTNLFQSPPPASNIKQTTNPNPKFFVPTASASAAQQSVEPSSVDTTQTQAIIPDSFSSVNNNSSFQSFPNPSSMNVMAKHKFASMDNVSEAGTAKFANHAMSPASRRTASWGSFSDQAQKPSSFMPMPMPRESGMMQSHSSSHIMDDELQEVDL